MNKKQQIILYLLVGTMFLSVIGTGLLLVFSGGDTTPAESSDDATAALQEQLEAQQQEAANCALTGDEKFDPAGKAPKAFVPEGDVKELKTEDITVGTGDEAKADSCITVHYHGSLAKDGTVFDSSYEADQPVKFPLSNVIEGWQQGVVGMKVGGERRLIIPSELAYGEAGSPPTIPENADLVFVVKLLGVE